MTPRPLVLLDVDGVLNCLGAGTAWGDWRSGWATAAGRRFRIRWSPSVVTRVLAWTDVADVQWLTTWGHDANRSLRHLLDVPELPVAGTFTRPGDDVVLPPEAGSHAEVTPAAPDELTGRWWKLDVVRRLVRTDPERPLVWLDDDLFGASAVEEWMRAHSRSLLVAPDPDSGLSPADLQAVEDYLSTVTTTGHRADRGSRA